MSIIPTILTSVATAATATAAEIAVHADTPPATGASKPPPTFKKPKKKGRKFHPMGGQVSASIKAGEEITAKSTRYAALLGGTAPRPEIMGKLMHNAGRWSELDEEAREWVGYCEVQRDRAWSEVHAQVKPLKTAFTCAVDRDAEVATEFPALAAFLAPPTLRARRAAETRKALADANNPTAAEKIADKEAIRLQKAKRRAARAEVSAAEAKARVTRLEQKQAIQATGARGSRAEARVDVVQVKPT